MAVACCEPMTHQLQFACDQHAGPADCPDKLVDYIPKYNEYGLLVHDGGSSHITIRFCPWCGTDLGPSYRMAWFDRLDALGLEPEDDLPPELTDETWWSTGSPAPDEAVGNRTISL